MIIGVIGLGKMGNAIVFRLTQAGFKVLGYDPNLTARQHAATYGAHVTDTLEHIPQQTRIIWLMIPAGTSIDSTLEKIVPFLQEGDVIIDGGNSHFTDSIRRATMLKKNKVDFLDCGTSGGLEGKSNGFSLMVGGNHQVFKNIELLFKAIATPDGYGYMGPAGAGHYVKMIHNGIEYSILQAYAEGLHLLHDGSYPNLNLANITHVWSHGSIIRSWILTLAHSIMHEDQELTLINGEIEESGTGTWMAQEAHDKQIPVPLLDQALVIRALSRKTGGNYGTKLVALLRHKFGGHPVRKNKEYL